MNENTLKSVYIESISVFDKDNYFDENSKVLGKATGFYYKYGDKIFLVTNKHVVTGKNTFTGENISKRAVVPTALRTVVKFDIVNTDDSHEHLEFNTCI